MKPRRVPIGKRNHLMTYEEPVRTTNNMNQSRVTGHAPHSTHWCELRTPTGWEAMDAQQRKATLSHIIVCAFPGFAFDPDGRFSKGSEVFNITAAFDPDGRRVETKLFATSAAGTG